MTLKFTVDSLDAVPEALRSFYTEANGKFALAVEGAVSKDRLSEFRDNNLTLKRQMDEMTARYDGIDPDVHRELASQAQKIKEKRLVDAGKLDEIVAERVAAMKADTDKQIKTLTGERAKAQAQLESLVLDGGLRDAAMKAGVKPTAVDDVLLRGRQTFRLHDGVAAAFDGDKPIYGKDGGPLPIHEWVHGLADRAPHLFEPSTGGGANVAKPGASGAAKTMTRSQFDALPAHDRASAIKGLTLVDD